MCFPIQLWGAVIPEPSGQLAELIVYINSTRVDLFRHQILLKATLFRPQCDQYIMWPVYKYVTALDYPIYSLNPKAIGSPVTINLLHNLHYAPVP